MRLRLEVRDGLIRACAVSGDFFSNRDIADLEARLIGRSSATEALLTTLRATAWEEFFVGCDAADMVRFFADALLGDSGPTAAHTGGTARCYLATASGK